MNSASKLSTPCTPQASCPHPGLLFVTSACQVLTCLSGPHFLPGSIFPPCLLIFCPLQLKTIWLKTRPSNFALVSIPCQGTDPEHLPEDIFIAFGFIIDDKIHGIGFLFPRICLLVYLNTRWFFLIDLLL